MQWRAKHGILAGLTLTAAYADLVPLPFSDTGDGITRL